MAIHTSRFPKKLLGHKSFANTQRYAHHYTGTLRRTGNRTASRTRCTMCRCSPEEVHTRIAISSCAVLKVGSLPRIFHIGTDFRELEPALGLPSFTVFETTTCLFAYLPRSVDT